jgi:hypothetical protein
MPPDLDIYLLTQHHTAETIQRFLDQYVDRAASDYRHGEEISVLPLNVKTEREMVSSDNMEAVPVSSLADILRYGLSQPPRAFYIHLVPKSSPIAYVMLGFTTDGQLILGLSIDDEGMLDENLTTAIQLLHQMAQEYQGHLGLILVETPPPLSEIDFREAAYLPLASYFIEFGNQ